MNLNGVLWFGWTEAALLVGVVLIAIGVAHLMMAFDRNLKAVRRRQQASPPARIASSWRPRDAA